MNTQEASHIFLATDHPSMAELLFYALGTRYHITQSPYRTYELLWLDQFVTCHPRPAAVILEVDCLWSHEWTAFTHQLGQAWQQRGYTLPLILINDYHGNEGDDRWMCLRKPFSIEHLRLTLARLLLQPDEQPTYLLLPTVHLPSAVQWPDHPPHMGNIQKGHGKREHAY